MSGSRQAERSFAEQLEIVCSKLWVFQGRDLGQHQQDVPALRGQQTRLREIAVPSGPFGAPCTGRQVTMLGCGVSTGIRWARRPWGGPLRGPEGHQPEPTHFCQKPHGISESCGQSRPSPCTSQSHDRKALNPRGGVTHPGRTTEGDEALRGRSLRLFRASKQLCLEFGEEMFPASLEDR